MISAILAWLIPQAATSFLGRYWKLIALAVALLAIAALVFTILLFKAQRDGARAEAALAQRNAEIYLEVNRRNVESLGRLNQEMARARASAEAELAAANGRAKLFADIAAEIANAPVSINPPVGPRLQLVYDRMRGQAAAGD